MQRDAPSTCSSSLWACLIGYELGPKELWSGSCFTRTQSRFKNVFDQTPRTRSPRERGAIQKLSDVCSRKTKQNMHGD